MSQHPLMALMLEHNAFVGNCEFIEGDIMPLPDQLALGPEDKASVTSSSTPLESDHVFVKVVDAEPFAERYPDWEERLLNGHLLCEYISKLDPTWQFGWFHRVKLFPLDEEQFAEAVRLCLSDEDWPDPVEWLDEVYRKYTRQLAEARPDMVARPATCGNCSSENVLLHVAQRHRVAAKAGVIDKPDRTFYVPITNGDSETTYTAHLHCQDCDSTAVLEDDDWEPSAEMGTS